MNTAVEDRHRYISAAEAAQLLGVKPQTLYSYISRGLLKSRPEPGTTRSLYDRVDVEQLAGRRNKRELQPGSEPRAERPDLGIPITTSITMITGEGPLYRAHPFSELVTHPGQFENVAELLWSGVLLEEPLVWDVDLVPQNLEMTLKVLHGGGNYVPVLRLLSAACLVLGESAADELRSGNTTRLARRLVMTFARCASTLQHRGSGLYQPGPGESIASVALNSLGKEPTPEAVAAVNSLLIACADHELSPATYAVRVAASAGAGIHACLIAGFSTHSGHRLGGSVNRLEDLISSSGSAKELGAKLAAIGRNALNSASPLPYTNGDPRARFLLDLARQLDSKGQIGHLQELLADYDPSAFDKPSLELGLVAVARALDLPRRAPGLLWVLGRSAGWVAHVIEQRLTASVMRPRARFT